MMESSTPPVVQCMVFSYFSTLSFQLFFTYWYAHCIIDDSLNIAQAAFESDWYTYEKDVQMYYILIIARAQKPLSLSIGPIYKMKVDALLSIFKAIYSYVALIQRN
ncbi:odorant receptor Or2-like [Aethina tumida]|uniref:odorant receptor Or2-like n=1 Tax=Aethina tumida TaxID=116153 RepID=UPI002148F193|nr:odorant receptor Or2-like [Aethina tumida]